MIEFVLGAPTGVCLVH